MGHLKNDYLSAFYKMNDFYKIQHLNNTTPPIRFAVEVDSQQYRIFSYFPIGSDGSFAVQTYLPSNAMWVGEIDKPLSETTKEERTLDSDTLKSKAKSFQIHKHSFHQSGVSNIKSTAGSRFPDDTDNESVSFAELRDRKDRIRLCCFYLVPYEIYPIRKEGDEKHHHVFNLPESLWNMPPKIEIRIAHKEFDLEKRMKDNYSGYAAFRDDKTLNIFDLSIYTVLSRSNNPHFAKDQFFIADSYVGSDGYKNK